MFDVGWPEQAYLVLVIGTGVLLVLETKSTDGGVVTAVVLSLAYAVLLGIVLIGTQIGLVRYGHRGALLDRTRHRD